MKNQVVICVYGIMPVTYILKLKNNMLLTDMYTCSTSSKTCIGMEQTILGIGEERDRGEAGDYDVRFLRDLNWKQI